MKEYLTTGHLFPLCWIAGVAMPVLVLIAQPVKGEDTPVRDAQLRSTPLVLLPSSQTTNATSSHIFTSDRQVNLKRSLQNSLFADSLDINPSGVKKSQAQPLPVLTKAQPVKPTRNLSLLSEIQPLTSAQMLLHKPILSQAGSGTTVQVTGVKLNSTQKGVEVILETPFGQQLQVVNRSEGNSFIADISNAQLRLPSGETFRANNPVTGISAVTVTNQNTNTIRVTVTGATTLPAVELFDSDQGLIFGLTPTSTQTPEQTQPAPTPTPTPEQTQPAPTPTPTPPANQTNPNQTPQSSEQEPIELIVTAEKTPENVQDVPISITVLDADQLEDANITSLEGAAKNTPNFSFFSSGGNRLSTFYSVRGINNFNLFSRDAVGFYVDDVPYDFSGFLNIDLNDLERVEVLRGPQNTLYGRSSLGGVVNVVTKRPTNKFEFSNSISYGSYDEFKSQASISGPLIENRLFYRLSGSYSTRDGYLYNTFRDRDVDGGSGGNGRLQLLWTPSKDWDISLNASFDDYREGAPPYVLLSQKYPFETQQDFIGFNDLVSNAQSLRIAYTNPNFRFTSISTHRYSSQKGAYDLDYTTADGRISAPDFQSSLFTQEFRLQSPEQADRFQWIFGGYFESSKFENNRPFIYGNDALALGFPFPPGQDKVDVDSKTNTYAVFGQLSYKPIEKVTLTAGLRYESTNSDIDANENFTSRDGSFILPIYSFENIEKNGDVLLPRFVLEYKFNPNVMVYGSIARGYQPPGASFQPFSEETATFDAERSWNYELGLKSSWFNNRLFVNLAVFHSPVDNFQFASLRDNRVVIDNADISVTGAELEIRATPATGLDIIAGLGFVDSEFKNGIDTFSGESLEGKKTSFAPDLTYNLAVQYRSSAGLLGRVELTGFGTTYFDDINTLKQIPYALVNVRLGYEFKNYGIYLFANNIFNNEYLTQAFDGTTGAAGTYGAPATYGVQFRSKF